METQADRILRLLTVKKMSQDELAGAIGASQAAISKIVLGETKRSKFLPKIADVLGVSEQWLIYGDSVGNGVRLTDTTTKGWDSKTELPEGMIAVPFFKNMSLSAGTGALNSDIAHTGCVLWFSKSFLRRQGACPENVFCITVVGDSMEPRYDEGGIVVIDTTQPISIIDGKTYAIHYQDQDYIKYLHRMPNNKVLVSSENPIYKPFEVGLEEINIVGRIIAYQREE